VRVPFSIIEIEPKWRGVEYFLVAGGNRTPRIMEIVAVVFALRERTISRERSR